MGQGKGLLLGCQASFALQSGSVERKQKKNELFISIQIIRANHRAEGKAWMVDDDEN